MISFKCGILNPLSIYTLYSQEKSYVFLMWDLKPINIYTLYFQEKNYVFSMWDNFFLI